MEIVKSILENAWEDGFFYHLRYGEFNKKEHADLIQVLTSCPDTTDSTIDKDLVRYLWFIPVFLENQKEFLLSRGLTKSMYTQMYDGLVNECERILGLP